jgi:hypothetical protein
MKYVKVARLKWLSYKQDNDEPSIPGLGLCRHNSLFLWFSKANLLKAMLPITEGKTKPKQEVAKHRINKVLQDLLFIVI